MPRLSNSSRILPSPSTISRHLAHHCLRCRLRRRIVRIETGPASCLTARLWHFGRWFDTCSVACLTACIYRFDSRRARRLARRLAHVALADLRFGGWFNSRRARRLAQRLARVALADLRFGGWFDSRRARRLAWRPGLRRQLTR